MAKFKVKFTEVLKRVIEIESDSEEGAIDAGTKMYKNGEVVLDSDDFNGNYEIEIAEKEHKVHFLFGTDNCKDFERGEITANVKNSVFVRTFNTSEEVKAYISGCEDLSGWNEYTVLSKSDLEKINNCKPKKLG